MVVADAAITGARRVQIKRYIEANLRNPDLSVRMVASAFSISPRYLHILFTSENETVSSYILRRRLEECGKQLTDMMWQRRTITEIAFGITSAHRRVPSSGSTAMSPFRGLP